MIAYVVLWRCGRREQTYGQGDGEGGTNGGSSMETFVLPYVK